MSAAEQCLGEGFEFPGTKLNDRARIVGKQIGRSRGGACPICKGYAVALITTKFSLYSNHLSNEIRNVCAAPIQRMTANSPAIFMVKTKKRVVTRDFHFWAVLGKSHTAENQSNDYEPSKSFHLLLRFFYLLRIGSTLHISTKSQDSLQNCDLDDTFTNTAWSTPLSPP